MKQGIRDATLREFEKFLLSHDNECNFAGLKRKAAPDGERCGVFSLGTHVEIDRQVPLAGHGLLMTSLHSEQLLQSPAKRTALGHSSSR